MMMLVLTVCSFEGTWNIDRDEKQCESTVFFFIKSSNLHILKKIKIQVTTIMMMNYGDTTNHYNKDNSCRIVLLCTTT